MKEFCNSNSPFLFQFNYMEVLSDLLEIFYYFKNESLEEISDDELILQKIYEEGKKKIKKSIEFGKELLNKLQENKIEIQHQAYCNTLKELQEFFRRYDYNFAA